MSETQLQQIEDPELKTKAVYTTPDQREVPTYMMTPQVRGLGFAQPNPENLERPFIPVYHEFNLGYQTRSVFEPAYEGRRFLVNTKTRVVYNRTGGKIIQFEQRHQVLLDKLCPYFNSDDLWLEVVFPCTHVAIGNKLTTSVRYFHNALIVLDLVNRELSVTARRHRLQTTGLPLLGIRERPKAGEVYLVPTFTPALSCNLYFALALQNSEWNGRYYSGTLCKLLNSYYHFQTESPCKANYSREFFPIRGFDGYEDV